MKKIIRVLALTLAFAVLCGSFATIAYAKDLAECHHCNTTGEFHCKEKRGLCIEGYVLFRSGKAVWSYSVEGSS